MAKRSEEVFLRQLEQVGKEQARIDASSPLPEWARPLASVLGDRPWQTLILSSFVLAVGIATWFYPLMYRLFEKGVLKWLLR